MESVLVMTVPRWDSDVVMEELRHAVAELVGTPPSLVRRTHDDLVQLAFRVPPDLAETAEVSLRRLLPPAALVGVYPVLGD